MKFNIKNLISAAAAAAAIIVSVPFDGFSDKAYATYAFDTNCSYVYDMLETQEEKDFYAALLKAANEVDDSSEDYSEVPYVSFGELGFGDKAIEVAWLFFNDHPEFFWMESSFTYSPFFGLSFSVFPEYQSGAARAAAKEKIIAVENEYIAGALQYDTQYERARYLHDALLEDISYEAGDLDQSIASAFFEKKTVCAGYSRAYSLLCNAVGIDTVIIISPVHAWNAVKIGTQWFLVDVTNDSGMYRFFLISEEEMLDLDIAYNAEYTMTVTENGVETVYNFYMHDIDYTLYPTYYESFPECDMTYDEYLDYLAQLPEYLLGDVNNDADIDARDATLVLEQYASLALSGVNSLTDQQMTAADVNTDSSVDARDATVILRYYAYRSLNGTGTLEEFMAQA